MTANEKVERSLLRKLAWCLLSEGEFIAAVTDAEMVAGDGTVPLTDAEVQLLRQARAHHEDRAWSHLRARARAGGMVRDLADEGRRRGVPADEIGEWVRSRVDTWVMDELARCPWPWSSRMDTGARDVLGCDGHSPE